MCVCYILIDMAKAMGVDGSSSRFYIYHVTSVDIEFEVPRYFIKIQLDWKSFIAQLDNNGTLYSTFSILV